MNPFRPFFFGLLLGGAAILATILAAQLGDDDESLNSGLLFPDGQSVAAVTLEIVHPAPSMRMMPLSALRPSDRELMAKLVHWLDEAREVQRPSMPKVLGASFLRLSFFASDGASVEVAAAVDCPSAANISGCSDVHDAIDVSRVGETKRYIAPGLAEWLRGAWEGEFRLGTWEAFNAEWVALRIPHSE